MSMTSNPASVVDDEAFTVTRSIRIAAPVEKVWAAVTEPEHISRWFGRAEFAGAGVGAGATATPGVTGTITWPGRDAVPLRIEAVDAPRLISYRWCNPCLGEPVPSEIDEAHSTVFTFTLEPVDGGTRLTVVETGFETTSDPKADLESHRGGWDGELDKLVALLESGATEAGATETAEPTETGAGPVGARVHA